VVALFQLVVCNGIEIEPATVAAQLAPWASCIDVVKMAIMRLAHAGCIVTYRRTLLGISVVSFLAKKYVICPHALASLTLCPKKSNYYPSQQA
jgi:hypothetical protein